MTQVQAFISGIYPRSEALAQATRDHDRGRIDQAQLARQLEADRRALLLLQTQQGCAWLTDGLLNWQDGLRPWVEASRGVRSGPLVRFFNTNTFYRQPVFEGAPELEGEGLSPYFTATADRRWLATLPSPCTLAGMSAGADPLAAALAALEPTLSWLEGRGFGLIQLQDPWLAYHGPALSQERLRGLSGAVERLLQARPARDHLSRIGLHLPLGDAAAPLEALWPLSLDFIGVDFFQTDLARLRRFNWRDKDLVAGCVNGRNSLLESEQAVGEFVERVLDELHPRALYLTNNVDLQFVPEPIARQKVALLGRVQQRFSSR